MECSCTGETLTVVRFCAQSGSKMHPHHSKCMKGSNSLAAPPSLCLGMPWPVYHLDDNKLHDGVTRQIGQTEARSQTQHLSQEPVVTVLSSLSQKQPSQQWQQPSQYGQQQCGSVMLRRTYHKVSLTPRQRSTFYPSPYRILPRTNHASAIHSFAFNSQPVPYWGGGIPRLKNLAGVKLHTNP